MVGPNVWGQSWAKGGRGKDGDQAECPLDLRVKLEHGYDLVSQSRGRIASSVTGGGL